MEPWEMDPMLCRPRFIWTVLIGLGLASFATVNSRERYSTVPNKSEKSASVLWRERRAPRRDAFRATDGRDIWTIPIAYYLDGSHTSTEVGLIKTALDQWQQLTCLRFVELKNDSSSVNPGDVTAAAAAADHQQAFSQPYLLFTAISDEGPDMNCFTTSIGPTKYVRGKGRPGGRRGGGGGNGTGQQRNRKLDSNPGTVVYLTRRCLSSKAAVGKVVHELGHVLAYFTHEHQRPDRDAFIEIAWANIDWRMTSQFNVAKPDELDIRFPYDYSSIMHYEGQAFSRGSGVDGQPLMTIRATDELYQWTMGQRVRLSFYDAKYANHIHCNHSCPAEGVALQCLHGGYSDPKNCSRCICPDGFGGRLCDSIPVNSPECLAPVNRIIVSSDDNDDNDDPQCISSPNYNRSTAENGSSYPLNLICTWHLSAASGCRIHLRFEGRVKMKTRKGSCQHWVEVKLHRNKEQAGPRFCDSVGSNLGLNGTLSSEDNLVVIIFQSHYDVDTNDRLEGFRLCFSLGKCDVDDVTLAGTHNAATEILAEESFQTEPIGVEGTAYTESHVPEEFLSETNRNNVTETLETDQLRLLGGISTDLGGKPLLETVNSESSKTNQPISATFRGLEKAGLTNLTTLELSRSSKTLQSKLILTNGKFTDLPVRITPSMKLQLNRENVDAISSRNDNEMASPESLKSEGIVSNQLGRAPEEHTTVKSELYKPLEFDSWTNNELEGLKATAIGEKYDTATSAAVVKGDQHHVLNKSVTGLKTAQRKFLISTEALATKDAASERDFQQVLQQEGSTVHSPMTSHVTPETVRTLLPSSHNSNVQWKHMILNQSLHNTKAETNASSVIGARFIRIFNSFICLLIIYSDLFRFPSFC